MTKDAFLSELQTAVTSTATAILAPTGWTTDNCPDLVRWFGYYRDKDAAHVERAIHKYASGTSSAESARDYIPTITSKVQRAVLRWTLTGEVTGVPEEAETTPGTPPVPDSQDMAAAPGFQGAPVPPVQRAARDGAGVADEAAGLLSDLGEGEPLDRSVASRFGSVLGGDFSHVRLHTGSKAAATASSLGARAFTYGHHVGFGADEYQPGTPVGDAIMAHELAHVNQQRDAGSRVGMAARRDSSGRPGAHDHDTALEHDADRTATSTVARLWGAAGKVANGVLQAPQHLRTARPRLQRCRDSSKPHTSKELLEKEKSFREKHDHLSKEQLDKIVASIHEVTGSDEVAYRFFDYYSGFLGHQILLMTPEESAKAGGDHLATTDPDGDTKLNRNVLDKPKASLGPLLLHELAHTRHGTNPMGFGDYQEGHAYGIEYYYAERSGDTARMEKIVEIFSNPGQITVPKLHDSLTSLFKTTYALMKALEDLTKTGSSTLPPLVGKSSEDGKVMMADFVSNFRNLSDDLQKLSDHIRDNLASLPYKLPPI